MPLSHSTSSSKSVRGSQTPGCGKHKPLSQAWSLCDLLSCLYVHRMHAAGSFGVFKSVLNAPLPRIYELSDKGPIPVEKSTMIVGTGVSFENLMASSSDLKAKLQQEVGCSACMCPVIKCTELSMHSHQLLLVTQRYPALYQPRPLHDDARRIYWVREMFQFHACAVPWSNPMRSLQTVPACCGQPAKCFLGHH